MDRLIVNDRVAKVIDLGFSAFDNFFQICREIGFTLEAHQHNIEMVILFLADKDRTSLKAFAMLREIFLTRAQSPSTTSRCCLVRSRRSIVAEK